MAVYDTTPLQGQSGWFIVGGTSLSAPLIAGLIGVVNQGGAPLAGTAAPFYSAATANYSGNFRDITSGTNGTCGSVCTATTGYDFVTGLGSPRANNFMGGQVTLTVSKVGAGNGTVTSNPAGINCGSTCSAGFTNGTAVTLTATPVGFSSFGGWSGCDSVSGNQCTVTMNANRTVTATFTLQGTLRTLTVNKAGTGSGTVTSNLAGINCGSTCSANFNNGTVVTLTATAASGSTFGGWSGCDLAFGAICRVTLTSNRTVTATFN